MLEVERVHRLRPVDRDDRGPAVALDRDQIRPRPARSPEEVDDLRDRRAGREDLGDALLLERGHVLARDRAADDDEHVLDAVLAQPLEDPRHERHVRAREDGDADGVRVLLDGGLDDLPGSGGGPCR